MYTVRAISLVLVLLIPSLAFGAWSIQQQAWVNPDNFKLQSTSRAIGNGTSLKYYFSNDFEDAIRPSTTNYDIGAFAYGASKSTGKGKPAPPRPYMK